MALTSRSFKPEIKLHLLNDSSQGLGGGWTFNRNLEKAMRLRNVIIADTLEASNICFVSGATMVTRETIDRVKSMGKKLVLRIDNIPRNSRNRNTGTSRLYEFAQKADAVIYQSQWSKNYVMPFVKRDGPVIYNGVDTDIFKPEGDKHDFGTGLVYLYSRYSRDETKNWEVAWYEYQMIHREHPDSQLLLVGRFSDEQREYNFDFYNNENVKYMGVIDNPVEMAKIYRSSDYFLATYYNDCYSNTYCEAVASGCELYKPNMSGGTPELVKNGVIPLDIMGTQFEALFEEVLKRG